MICPKCGNENPELGKFCDHCGASLEQRKVCSRCGTESPQTSRFCDHCGADLDQANVCPKCGVEHNKGAKFCTRCGTPLEAEDLVKTHAIERELGVRSGISEAPTDGVKLDVKKGGSSRRLKIIGIVGGVVLIVIIVALLSNQAAPSFDPVTFTDGDDVTITSQVISSTGGIIEVGSKGTPIDDVQVQFPAGALIRDTNVSLGYDTGALTPNEGIYGGVALILDTGDVTEFEQPVTITVPFTDTDTTPVPYYLDSEGKLHLAQLMEIDRTAKTFSFETFHASLFTWILSKLTGTEDEQKQRGWECVGGECTTGYSLREDGFQVRNNGSEFNREGECAGMTAWSLWYYEKIKPDKGSFYPKFMNVIGTDIDGNPVHGQDIIATRAFISKSQTWTTYYRYILDQEKQLSDKERYDSIINAIINTRNPVLLHLSGEHRSHSVLAYAFHYLDKTISIYDPNYPGQSKFITYDLSTESFNSYSGFDRIVYCGDGSLVLDEPFYYILYDAWADFHGSVGAVIDIGSHTDGQEVTERHITLTGMIQSGEVSVTRLNVFVGSTKFQTNVGYDGSFNIPISLESGTNSLQFSTAGTDADGDLIPLSNNMPLGFTLNLNIPSSVILVTLTWDTNDTDVDLYVIDPTEDYSCWYHETTADGGELDYDITTGYGPEHWTLMTADTVRYGQLYKVRVHYYSDHSKGPTNYTVSIKLYEGTSREVEYWYRGNLAVDNSSNDDPDDTGPDWVDIAEIILTK